MTNRKHVSVLVFLHTAVVNGTLELEQKFSQISGDLGLGRARVFTHDGITYADLMQPSLCRSVKSNGNQSGIDPVAQILSKLSLKLELQFKLN